MSEVIWQLPVIPSNVSDHDWVHPKAKYHAFSNNESICNKFYQNTNFFETNIDEVELLNNKDLACKKCMKKLGISY